MEPPLETRELERRLDRWVEAGLLEPRQAARIADFETDRGGGETSNGRRPATRGERRSGVAEAVGYVGAALALAAIGLILGDLWRELTPGGRVSLAALVTVITAGSAVALRAATAPALQRLTSVLSAAAAVGGAWVLLAVGLGRARREVTDPPRPAATSTSPGGAS